MERPNLALPPRLLPSLPASDQPQRATQPTPLDLSILAQILSAEKITRAARKQPPADARVLPPPPHTSGVLPPPSPDQKR